MDARTRLPAIGGRARRVVLAYAAFSVVEYAIWVAVILYAYGVGGTALAGLVGVVQLLPAAFLSPTIASLGDRLPRGTALVGGYLAMCLVTAAVAIALLLDAPTWAIVTLSAVATTLVSAVRPVHFAAVPALARSSGELVAANSYSSAGEGVAAFLGPVLAGVVAQVAGPSAVFIGASLLSAVAAASVLALGLPRGEESDTHPLRAALAGLAHLRGDWPALSLLLVMAVGFVLTGAVDVLGVTYAVGVLGEGEASAGLIIGAAGIGGVLGALSAAWFVNRPRLVPVLLVGGLLQGAGVAAVAAVGSLPGAMLVLTVAGASGAIVLVGGRTLIQRATDDRVLARVFAVQESTALLGLALGTAIAPLLVEAVGGRAAFVPLGLGALGVVALGVILARRLDDRAVYPAEAIALLRSTAMLALAPQPALERMAREGVWREVATDEVVVRQGDRGDEFFVVASGSLGVEVDGVRRPHRISVGEGFGEIALLLDVPRTATVLALEPTRVLAVGSAAFLAAVTGDEDLRRRADATARGTVAD